MKVSKGKISVGEVILSLGLIMAIFGVIITVNFYEPETDLKGIFIWITVSILLLAIGIYAVIISLIKRLDNIEGKISAIVIELKKRKPD